MRALLSRSWGVEIIRMPKSYGMAYGAFGNSRKLRGFADIRCLSGERIDSHTELLADAGTVLSATSWLMTSGIQSALVYELEDGIWYFPINHETKDRVTMVKDKKTDQGEARLVALLPVKDMKRLTMRDADAG